LRANLKSISHRCHLFEVAFVWELTKETIHLPLGCLKGGEAELGNRAGLWAVERTAIRRTSRKGSRPSCTDPLPVAAATAPTACSRERIFIELMTSDRKLKASIEGSKWRIYGT